MVQLKADEFLVGAGDGSLSHVCDTTAKISKKGNASKVGFSFSLVKEPTKPCFEEVSIRFEMK